MKKTFKKFLSGVDSVQIAGRRRYTCTDLARKIEAALARWMS